MNSVLKRTVSIAGPLRTMPLRSGRALLLAAVLASVAVCLFGCGDNSVNNGASNYTLQISTNPIGGGTVSRNPDKSTYSAGEQVTVEAQPASGYSFVAWSGVSTSTSTSVTVTMNADVMLTANFQQQSVTPPVATYLLTTNVSPAGGGTLSRNPNNTSYTSGTSVTVTATATSGYIFTGWSDASTSTSTSVTLTMNGNKELTANFQQGFTDSRDGKTYTLVEIGGQTWMAENLNYQISSGSWCNSDNNSNCNQYGRLYNWNVAMTACPTGWHLPTNQEWTALVTAVGGSSVAGTKLKTTSGWNNNGNGMDNYRFSALPGGYRDGSDGNFGTIGYYGYWWTATANDNISTLGRYMSYENNYVNDGSYDKNAGLSVRCVLGTSSSSGTTYTLTTNASPATYGSVICNPPNSPGQPIGTYTAGTQVLITSTPTNGYFTGWSGASNSTSTSVTITMNSNKILTANFRTYKTVVIGGKTWMAENLNYQVDNSMCYGNSVDSCNKYGRLYSWNAANRACSAGAGTNWHLPSRQEWDNLAEVVGGEKYYNYGTHHDWSLAGKKLKARSGWNRNGNGTDDYGFSALPGGASNDPSNSYSGGSGTGNTGYWWSTTEYSSTLAYYRTMNYNMDDMQEDYQYLDKSYGMSVRCIRN
jgi:uncharacterized protein (TIGR02145 family)/uncharacterized repeat protein (TIGR02543 family)